MQILHPYAIFSCHNMPHHICHTQYIYAESCIPNTDIQSDTLMFVCLHTSVHNYM